MNVNLIIIFIAKNAMLYVVLFGKTKKPAPIPKELGQTLNVCGATQFAEKSAARFRIPAYALR